MRGYRIRKTPLPIRRVIALVAICVKCQPRAGTHFKCHQFVPSKASHEQWLWNSMCTLSSLSNLEGRNQAEPWCWKSMGYSAGLLELVEGWVWLGAGCTTRRLIDRQKVGGTQQTAVRPSCSKQPWLGVGAVKCGPYQITTEWPRQPSGTFSL